MISKGTGGMQQLRAIGMKYQSLAALADTEDCGTI